MIEIITYQDLQEAKDRIEFVNNVISDHKNSELYKTAVVGKDYAEKKNTTIMTFQKLLYTVTGKVVPDNISANYKMPCGFFKFFITQEYQYLLSNGVSWGEVEEPLGKDFDTKLQEAAKKALWGGVSFGLWNKDHVDVFDLTEFAPLYDEENGVLRAGVRFWQIDKNKPLRATLYEEDGYTNYIWREGKGELLNGEQKKTYIQTVRSSEVDGTEIFNAENYPSFPVVPLWGNPEHQSEIVGLREQIDGYDLIKSGYCNTVDEASIVYWTLTNAGGMDDLDLAKFVERLKTVHAATLDNDIQAERHSQEVPHDGRDALLDRLRADLYEAAMALDLKNLSGGNITATQILAAYEALDSKVNEFEYCVIDFIQGLLKIAGVEAEPTFTRSKLVNTQEQIQTLMTAATYLDEEYMTTKVLELLGDGDKAEEMIRLMQEDNMTRLSGSQEGVSDEEEGNPQPNEETTVESAEEVTGKSLSPTQINTMMSIISQYTNGTMTLNQAANVLSISIGITKEQAIKILKDEEV